MKSNWMIAVEAGEYENVLTHLANKNIKILNQMENIHVIMVEATPDTIAPIKNIKGVIAAEPEGNVSTQ